MYTRPSASGSLTTMDCASAQGGKACEILGNLFFFYFAFPLFFSLVFYSKLFFFYFFIKKIFYFAKYYISSFLFTCILFKIIVIHIINIYAVMIEWLLVNANQHVVLRLESHEQFAATLP